MEYKVTINDFEGPLDLLLHLIKESNIDIWDISLEDITKQYLDYIENMKKINLNIASEYLTMAAELIELKSKLLLPNHKMDEEEEFYEDPKEELINKLILYKQYKDISNELKALEENRSELFTRDPSFLTEYKDEIVEEDNEQNLSLELLVEAFNKFLERQESEKPLNTKVTNKEYSITKRSDEISKIIRTKKKVEFFELIEEYNKSYFVVTFLSILTLAKKNVIDIKQDHNFNKIFLLSKES